MKFISHPLIKPETIEERDYQINVLNTSINRNTLCVLPTGTGKTNVAILLAANRLEKYPDSRILILAPTRPLCAQHQKSFQDSLNIPEEDIILLTGKLNLSFLFLTNLFPFLNLSKILSTSTELSKV